MPMAGIVEATGRRLAYRGEPATSRVLRTTYEVCLFRALREQPRCKEIWVEGADLLRGAVHIAGRGRSGRR